MVLVLVFFPCMDNKSKKMALDIERRGYCC